MSRCRTTSTFCWKRTPKNPTRTSTADGTLAGNGLVCTNAESTYATVLTGTSYGRVDVTFDATAYPAPLSMQG
ncbi:hypothetical protein ACGF8B_36965 [Streptomyces sp. NPDC047917]|uniref:hypothetical protein n=1 Tax=Streptomyces sp. NPDC047917 TaxID=3365491 RepID=UPI003714A644